MNKNKMLFFEALVNIIGKLENGSSMNNLLNEVFQVACETFSYTGSFVYELDYQGVFNLYSCYVNDDKYSLPKNFSQDAIFDASEVGFLKNGDVIFGNRVNVANKAITGLKNLFATDNIVFTCITDEKQEIIGLVGLMSITPNITFDEQTVPYQQIMLKTMANRIKLFFYQRRLLANQDTLLNMIDHTGVDIYVTDYDTYEVIFANQSMAAPYGGIDQLVGKKCWKALYDDKTGPCDFCPKHHLIDEQGNFQKYSWDYERPFDGSWFRVTSSTFNWMDGRRATVITSADITKAKRNENLVSKMAFYDNLTGMPNRNMLDDDLFESKASENGYYFVFMDLDRFKQVNDTYGHSTGDELLLKIASVLKDNPTLGGKAYRYGGDEFIALINKQEDIGEIMTYLIDLFDQEWQLSSMSVQCGASFGVAKYPEDGTTYSELLEKADRAMYLAKREKNR